MGKGWLRLLFVVEPDILRGVLIATKPVLLIMNGRVPAEYESTPLDDYVAGYSRYLGAMLESPEAAHEAASGIYIGLAASLARFWTTPCAGGRYKLMKCDEPVVSLTPFMLHFNERRGQLFTNVFSHRYSYFGVEMSFRRVVSLDRDEHALLYETNQFPTYGIFEGVKSRIQKVTKPCKIRSPSREHRTPIRITEAMNERMRRHLGLKAAGLELV